MFVQSADFVKEHRKAYKDTEEHELVVHGVEKEKETVKIARMNMFLNGLRSQIVNANSYYDDPFDTYGHFDYVMANPPFNVDDVNLDKVKCQRRFSEYGIPQNKSKKTGRAKEELVTVPNANYLWINLFATSLKPKGRAALVMPNSASDARNTEADIRRRLIESGIISCMLSLPRNMFYTVTLPATLWFFDKARTDDKRVLFIDGDLRQASASRLWRTPLLGLTDYLHGEESDYRRLLFHPEACPMLDVLPAGALPTNPTELLRSPRLAELFATLRQHYDSIIIDSPSAGMLADADIIEHIADCTLFIIRAGRFNRHRLDEINAVHSRDNNKPQYVILNGVSINSRYGYAYLHKYERSEAEKNTVTISRWTILFNKVIFKKRKSHNTTHHV